MTAPISKALEEAVESAARRLMPDAWERGASADYQQRAKDWARTILEAAFPGLFDGTMWLAPWEADSSLQLAALVAFAELSASRGDIPSGATPERWMEIGARMRDGREVEVMFAAMREAYLNAEQPLDPDAGLPTPEDVRGILKEQKDAE